MARKTGDAAPHAADIVIAGAGYVGLSLAVAVKAALPGLSVTLVDAAPAGVWEKDPRASAIAAAACRLLATLGTWNEISAEAEPIIDMVVTDSKVSDPVRPVYLDFGGEAAPGEPFAHMIPNVAMNRALRRRCGELGIAVLEGVAVTGFRREAGWSVLSLADGTVLSARLAVGCDGVHSTLRGLAGIRTVHFDYDQKGIVGTVRHERPHGGRADEHFLPAGPFAILPLKSDDKGHKSSIVWTERSADADRLVAEDPFVFAFELEQRFGHRLGAISFEGRPRAFPLGLRLARDWVKDGLALAGDAAHGVHPIAGQGLNLGFRDVAALAEVIVEAARLGQDFGSLAVLERYEQWRRFDTVRMGVTTDVLNRMFSSDFGPLRLIRDVGLGLVDRMPAMKRYFIGQAAGLAPDNPRLLRGEAI